VENLVWHLAARVVGQQEIITTSLPSIANIGYVSFIPW